MDTETEELLNGKQLAAKLERHPTYVTAMRAAGYEFKYKLTTTLSHAQSWLKENYTFRSTGYFHPTRVKRKAAAAAN